eukprot:gene26406-17504_t
MFLHTCAHLFTGTATTLAVSVAQTLSPASAQAVEATADVATPASAAATETAEDAVRGIIALRDPSINRVLSTSAVEPCAMDWITERAIHISGGSRALYGLLGLLPPGLSTSAGDRVRFGLEGLLPPGDASLDLEVERARHTKEFLPVIYTPTVGEACLTWGTLLPRPTGLYISLQHYNEGRIDEVVNSWPQDKIKITVITDGERILGLGDLGAHGMGIPVGKVMVYGACGVDPASILPLLVDVGCDTESIRSDPFYVGARQARERGELYYDPYLPPTLTSGKQGSVATKGAWQPRERGELYYTVMEAAVEAVQRRWGSKVIIHWEDVGRQHSFELLKRLGKSGVPTFNDDIQCTSAIVLAAMLAATRLEGVPKIRNQTVFFFGAGQTSVGCAGLLVAAMKKEGLSEGEACDRIFLMNSKGLVLRNNARSDARVQRFAKDPADFSGSL